jgi:hypothetical protein
VTILQGTMQDGTVIPVQVDAQGRLVAEGLQGAQGPPGAQGPAGGSFALPSNPQEGDALVWSNGQLAWAAMASPVEMYPRIKGEGYAQVVGEPYVVGVRPAAADFNYNPTPSLRGLFDGDTGTYIYFAGSDYSSGNVTRLLVDLRDYVKTGITQVEVYAGVSGSTFYYARACAGSSAVAVGSEVKLDYATQWRTVPLVANCRYLEVYAPNPVGARLNLHAIRVNGSILSGSTWTDAVSSATPY